MAYLQKAGSQVSSRRLGLRLEHLNEFFDGRLPLSEVVVVVSGWSDQPNSSTPSPEEPFRNSMTPTGGRLGEAARVVWLEPDNGFSFANDVKSRADAKSAWWILFSMLERVEERVSNGQLAMVKTSNFEV